MSTKCSAEMREDPSNNWKPGIFNFNRKDKHLFPPKRMKAMGWTVNFANPFSIISLLVLMAAILFSADLVT